MTDKAEERRASLYFAIVGVGYLFPFSAMTQPADYWKLLFPDFNIIFLISAVFMYTNLTFLTFLVFFTKEHSSRMFLRRIFIGFTGQLIALVLVPSLYFFHLEERIDSMVILLTTGFMALATALLDSSVIAVAGCYPLSCQEALQLGVGLSTLIGSVYRIITKASFPVGDDGTIISSLVYFYSGSATIILCMMALSFLLKMKISKVCLFSANISEEDPESDIKPLLESVPVEDDLDSDNIIQSDSNSGVFDRKAVFWKSFVNGMTIVVLFLTTLALWPALITEIPTYQFPSLDRGSWWPLLLLGLFALMDVVGRFNVAYRFGFNRSNIWIAVALRLVFLPLIVLCVKGIIQHDAFSLIFVAILGWSNGWCGSLCILFMTECGSSDSEKRYLGTLASFYLNFGLVLGSTVGLLLESFLLNQGT
jgi:equilibrative nucleoside transporter 1/2/3